MTLPALKITGGQLQDPAGNRVLLRGISSQGMCMVYGDQANPGTYVPMTVAQYVQRATQTDAQGKPWCSRAIRLCFERFPCTNPGRMSGYSLGKPYAMPDTIAFAPWAPLDPMVLEGETRTYAGNRWRALKLAWRADRGEGWFPGQYAVGDVRSGVGTNHLYRCASVPTTPFRPPQDQWDHGPQGTDPTNPVLDAFQNGWLYLGEFGTTGTTVPFSSKPIPAEFDDGGIPAYPDGWVWWQFESPDEPASQEAADFAAWKAKVLDPAVQAAVDAGLYAIITDFDFGPAQHPLRGPRMLAFWQLLAASQWANHPQVLFELWNESEDVGGYPGNAGSWAAQKPIIQRTLDAIRAAGAGNVVIATTPFYCSCVGEATANPLSGSNVGYAFHMYASEWGSSANQQQLAQGLASGQAVFITEFGDDSNPTDPANTWLKVLLAAIASAKNPPAAMIAWAETDSWAPSLFSDDALTQPTIDGQAVRQWLDDNRSDAQPGGPPALAVQTAAPILDPAPPPPSTPGAVVTITGRLAPVVVVTPPPPPPPPPLPAKTPLQVWADANLARAKDDAASAQALVDALADRRRKP